MAKRYTLDKKDGLSALKVALYSGAAAVIGSIIVSVGDTEIPTQYMAYVPIINVILVALKDFFEDRAS